MKDEGVAQCSLGISENTPHDAPSECRKQVILYPKSTRKTPKWKPKGAKSDPNGVPTIAKGPPKTPPGEEGPKSGPRGRLSASFPGSFWVDIGRLSSLQCSRKVQGYAQHAVITCHASPTAMHLELA